MRSFVSLFLLLSLTLAVPAADWPQWRGPDRTGISKEKGLLTRWADGPPKLLWKATGLGGGYSTPSMVGGKLYVMGAKDMPDERRVKGTFDESVLCLDTATGKELWATKIGQTMGDWAGPRSTPTIDQGRAYAISSNGVLACLDAEKGTLIWQKDLRKEFGGRVGPWAYAESPLIDGEVLVCTPGGEKAALVALQKKDGSVIWRATTKGLKSDRGSYASAAYASAIVAESGNVKQYVQFLSGGVIGVAAKDGKVLWHYEAPANRTANCSTPLFHDDSVFAASSYGTGGGRARVVRDGDSFKAEEMYFVKKMQNHHGGLILLDGHIYGTGSNTLLCVNFKDGSEAGSARSAGKGSITYADGHLYHRGEDGTVCLVEANPGLKERGRFKQPDRSKLPAWAHPVVANGVLYIRDWDVLYAYDVKAK
ncbi:MAG: PQQ-binding-like beta-propeller repeat protein [Gemmataceae bacterium]